MRVFTCNAMNVPGAVVEIEVSTSSPLSEKRKTQQLKKRKAKQQTKKRDTQSKKNRQPSSSRRSSRHKRVQIEEQSTAEFKEADDASISSSGKCTRKRRLITKHKFDETIVELQSVTGCNILSEIVSKVDADGVHLVLFQQEAIFGNTYVIHLPCPA